MLYILAFIIITYTSTHIFFKRNETYLKVRKYIDIATVIVTTTLVITWVEVFKLSVILIFYFFISLVIFSYFIQKLRLLEMKKVKAESIIKELKNEEKILENRIEVLENEKK